VAALLLSATDAFDRETVGQVTELERHQKTTFRPKASKRRLMNRRRSGCRIASDHPDYDDSMTAYVSTTKREERTSR
jgi:hypothetical protein